MAFLDKICSALGHKLRNTLVIEQSGDFYEVDYRNTALGAARLRLDHPWRKRKRRLKISF